MSAEVRCTCGALLRAPAGSETRRALCPVCQRTVSFEATAAAGIDEALPVTEFLDPPAGEPAPAAAAAPWAQRMLAALVDPRSIQWMMMLGGGLMVLGLIVWLVSKGIFENTLVVAASLTAASLLVHGAGCYVATRTRFKTAGQALTFLGCILLPLNLWFYHAQGLLTLEGNLWVGGVVCSAIYVATVLLLRDPIFLYAVEGGVTLTVALLLANQGYVTDVGYLSLVLLGLALVSIHAERGFPPEAPTFDRRRFGLPLFWSGHAQLAAALVLLATSQVLALLAGSGPLAEAPLWHWTGNWLARHPWLAGGMWLAGAYVYLYSDLVVRRIGLYVYLAAACLVAAELTLLGNRVPADVLVAAPAVTALLLTLITFRPAAPSDRLAANVQPLALLLAGLSVVAGAVQHVRATSALYAQLGLQTETGWPFVAAMVVVLVCTRSAAVVFQKRSPALAANYLLLSAASVLVLLAGALRASGIVVWWHQAPLLMLVPIGYLAAARLWRGQQPERPLAIAAQIGMGVILLHVVGSTVPRWGALPAPAAELADANKSLWLALAFALASVFYLLAAALRRHGANVYAATACLCAVVWQLAGYFDVPHEAYITLYGVLGLVVLAAARAWGVRETRTFRTDGGESTALLGPGAPAFWSATALLSLAFLSALLRGLARLAAGHAAWPLLGSLAVTIVICLAAAALAPSPLWRRAYVVWAIALAAVAFLTLNVLIDLTLWQKAEIFCVALSLVLLVAGYIGRFLETSRDENDAVTLALFFGSVLGPAALLIGTLYARFVTHHISLPDELGLVALTVLMLVTGYSWQLKAPTLFGALGLAVYLLVLIGMLAVLPNAAMGVYLAVGGCLLFAAGLALSVYRDRLLELPGKIKGREGVFRVLDWR